MSKTVPPEYQIGKLNSIIKNQSKRIKELEAELQNIKKFTKAKWIDATTKICPKTTEEGEG